MRAEKGHHASPTNLEKDKSSNLSKNTESHRLLENSYEHKDESQGYRVRWDGVQTRRCLDEYDSNKSMEKVQKATSGSKKFRTGFDV